MLQTFLITVVLLGLAIALIAVKNLLGKGEFRPGHACRFGNKLARKASASRGKSCSSLHNSTRAQS